MLLGVLGMSVAATANLVAEQLDGAPTAEAQKIDVIVAELSGHGLRNAGWTGSEAVARRLSQVTGKRIRLTTPSGTLLVDTDLLAGRRPRPVGEPVARIDARPRLSLAAAQRTAASAVTMLEIRRFRQEATRSACLTRAGVPVDVTPSGNGVPRLAAAPGALPTVVAAVDAQCPTDHLTAENFVADHKAILGCSARDDSPDAEWTACLRTVFAQRTGSVTAGPAELFVGTRRDDATVAFTPPVVVAVAVGIAALLGAVVTTQRLLRDRAAGRLAAARPARLPAGPAVVSDPSTEQLADALRRQRQLVADVAHELRAPLTNVRAYLEALSEGVISPEPALFASLHEEAMLQQRIIDDLGEPLAPVERIPAPRSAEWDLAPLVESCHRAHLPAARAAGLRLTVAARGPLPVVGDLSRLRQVLGNLLGNAVRYTPFGGSVRVLAWRYGDQVCVQVRDTGTGISEQDLPRVFDRLWRSETARRQAVGGTGLGLYIAREIVVAHGGRISIDSQLDVGTTVTVLLPVAVAPAPPTGTER